MHKVKGIISIGLIGLGVVFFTGVSPKISLAEDTYICYRYVDGEPTGGFIKVKANSKEEAERKALREYREKLNMRTDYVKCEYSW